jgi:hypothetical protein
MVGDASQDIAQVGLGVEPVEGRALDKGVEDGRAMAAAVGAGEQVILPSQGDRAAILPMSGRRSRCTIAGTPSMGAAFGASAASSE